MKRYTTLTAVGLAALMGLTGCAHSPENEEPVVSEETTSDSEALHAEIERLQQELAAQEDSDTEDTAEETTSDEEGSEPVVSEEEDEDDEGLFVDRQVLLVEAIRDEVVPEEGTTYVRAQQAFNPTLAIHTLVGDEMSFTEYRCTGGVKTRDSGQMVRDGSKVAVSWYRGRDPLYDVANPSRYEIYEGQRILDERGEGHFADVDMEIDTWVSMCGKAAEMLYQVFLPSVDVPELPDATMEDEED